MQVDEEHKSFVMAVYRLTEKFNICKRQLSETEGLTAKQLQRVRRCQHELEDADGRADQAESSLHLIRAKHRSSVVTGIDEAKRPSLVISRFGNSMSCLIILITVLFLVPAVECDGLLASVVGIGVATYGVGLGTMLGGISTVVALPILLPIGGVLTAIGAGIVAADLVMTKCQKKKTKKITKQPALQPQPEPELVAVPQPQPEPQPEPKQNVDRVKEPRRRRQKRERSPKEERSPKKERSPRRKRRKRNRTQRKMNE